MKYTTDEMMRMIASSRERLAQNPREVVLANNSENDANSREVYKDKKIKRTKDVSRSSEEMEALTSSPLGQTPQEPQEEVSNIIAPASTSSRIKGITAQHVKTNNGIKLNVAIQTEEDAKEGMYVELTAELKRHSRLRELKLYEPDDAYFQEFYISTINELKELKPAEGKYLCMGRLHVRGARGHWFANMMVVGKLNEDDILHTVFLHINEEEFVIELNGELSELQKNIYHNTGIYGNLTRRSQAPRLETAKRKAFNP